MRKQLLGWAALPILGYAGICAWLFAKQRDLIYLPQDNPRRCGADRLQPSSATACGCVAGSSTRPGTSR